MILRRCAEMGAVLVLVSGCLGSPEDYETDPVVVSTPAGDVTCQLYRPDLVVWDRAIGRPDSMSVETADNVCKQEGLRIKGGDGAVDPEAAADPIAEDAPEPKLKA